MANVSEQELEKLAQKVKRELSGKIILDYNVFLTAIVALLMQEFNLNNYQAGVVASRYSEVIRKVLTPSI